MAAKEPKYEDGMKALEELVQKLEQGQLSLDESLAAFQEGMRLSRLLGKKLDETEKKVEILLEEKDASGRRCRKKFKEKEGEEDS